MLMTVAELAHRWRVPRQTIWKWIKQERIPYVQFGRIFRFDPDAIAAWEQAGGEKDARAAARASRPVTPPPAQSTSPASP